MDTLSTCDEKTFIELLYDEDFIKTLVFPALDEYASWVVIRVVKICMQYPYMRRRLSYANEVTINGTLKENASVCCKCYTLDKDVCFSCMWDKNLPPFYSDIILRHANMTRSAAVDWNNLHLLVRYSADGYQFIEIDGHYVVRSNSGLTIEKENNMGYFLTYGNKKYEVCRSNQKLMCRGEFCCVYFTNTSLNDLLYMVDDRPPIVPDDVFAKFNFTYERFLDFFPKSC